jgi:hypothetical protein
VTPQRAARILRALALNVRDASNTVVPFSRDLRLLEKTPKNALRVPFLDQLFPDCSFVFLWRDPRESIASIVRAWRSGKWKTYNGLQGFAGPWSLLLPPGWQELNGRPLEEIAAFQWDSANRIVLDDLVALKHRRWTTLRYADFIADPHAHVTRLCTWLGIDMDAALTQRLSQPLPHSRFTLTPPRADKWREDEPQINRVLPLIESTWRRLQEQA